MVTLPRWPCDGRGPVVLPSGHQRAAFGRCIGLTLSLGSSVPSAHAPESSKCLRSVAAVSDFNVVVALL